MGATSGRYYWWRCVEKGWLVRQLLITRIRSWLPCHCECYCHHYNHNWLIWILLVPSVRCVAQVCWWSSPSSVSQPAVAVANNRNALSIKWRFSWIVAMHPDCIKLTLTVMPNKCVPNFMCKSTHWQRRRQPCELCSNTNIQIVVYFAQFNQKSRGGQLKTYEMVQLEPSATSTSEPGIRVRCGV